MRRLLFFLGCMGLASITDNLRAEGLICRLPVDGAWVSYDLQSTGEMHADGTDLPGRDTPKTFNVRGMITLSSVGQTTFNDQKCRWVEIKREVPEDGIESILKLLIPERFLSGREDPFAHVLRR